MSQFGIAYQRGGASGLPGAAAHLRAFILPEKYNSKTTLVRTLVPGKNFVNFELSEKPTTARK